MRRNMFCTLAVAAALAAVSSARADLPVVLGSLSPAAPDVAVPYAINGAGGGYTGFSFEFDFAETPNDASWASDLQLCLTPPSGTQVCYGGFGGDAPASLALWPFDGPPSDAAGHYSASFSPAAWAGGTAAGDWAVTVENDWDTDPGNTHFNNMVLTLTPEPTTLGLLGLGGLLLIRRRR